MIDLRMPRSKAIGLTRRIRPLMGNDSRSLIRGLRVGHLAVLVAVVVQTTRIPTMAHDFADGHKQSASSASHAANDEFEGPPIVVPDSNDAFALRSTHGEEVANEPLVRVNLLTGVTRLGPRIPDDAVLAAVAGSLLVLAPRAYSQEGVVTGPWHIWTVNPWNLKVKYRAALLFVHDFGVTVPPIDDEKSDSIWIGNGILLRKVRIRDGVVVRTVALPATTLSIDPTGRRLYALAGDGSAGDIEELNAITGRVIARSNRRQPPATSLTATGAGVFLIGAGVNHDRLDFLEDQSLRPIPLLQLIGSTAQLGAEPSVITAGQTSLLGGQRGLVCLTPTRPPFAIRTEHRDATAWVILAVRGQVLYVWTQSAQNKTQIESVALPQNCGAFYM